MNKKRILALCLAFGLISQSFISLTTNATTSEAPIYKYDPTTGSYDTNTPILLHENTITAPTEFTAQKEQFRTAWVSTVARIDYPSAATFADNVLTLEELKADFITVLNRHEEYNLNAVTFQASPMLDAWYKSDLVPWTQYLSDGKYTSQGQAPSYGEDFDLFAWMIDETHKRGMEFHAWFNPYRVTNDAADIRTKDQKLADLSDKNFAKKHPDMVLEFQNKLFLDPGRSEVIDFVKARVDEVCSKYDVDAIHFDDYFYPYRYTDSKGNWVTLDTEKSQPVDWDTFNNPKYNRGFTDIKAWRESNVTNLIAEISYVIDYHNMDHIKSVQFGVSPFGIWGHKGDETTDSRFSKGSDTPTSSTSSLRDQYANTRDWVDNKWIDYLTPQIYWGFQTTAAPYGELADWWANTLPWYGVNLYTGHANYKHSQSWIGEFKNPEEIGTQLRFNQKYPTIKGSAFFSLDKLIPRANAVPGSANDVLNKSQQVIKQTLSLPANTPGMDWLDRYLTYSIYDVSVTPVINGNSLTWSDENKDTEFYCVYRQEGKVDKVDTSNPANMIGRFGKNAGDTFVDTDIVYGKDYTYAITVIDEAGMETPALSKVEMNVAATVKALPKAEDITLSHKKLLSDVRALVNANNIDPSSIDLKPLFAAEAKYNALEAEQLAKEKAAIDAIAALPEVDSVTLANADAISNARTLVSIAKNDTAITNLYKLIAVELKLQSLKEQVEREKDAIAAINAIPELEKLTLADETLLVAARVYVDVAKNNSAITNLDKLVKAEAKMVELKAQAAKEKAAMDAIVALPYSNEITLSHEAAVISARALVTAANNDKAILNLDKLIAVEKKLAQIKEAIAIQAAKVQAAINAIYSLPESSNITLANELAVKEARELVTAANDNASINNLNKLVTLEAKIKELKDAAFNQANKEKAAIEAIEALPELTQLTLNDEKVVNDARELVKSANNDKAITNIDKLVKAEAKIAELKKTGVTTIPSNNNNNNGTIGKGDGNLPNTGGTAATGVLILGSLLTGGGAYFLKRKK